MSVGHWDYGQHRLIDVYEDIDRLVEKNGQPKTEQEKKEERWYDDDWYEKYPEDLNHRKYPEEVIEEFKRGSDIIKLAYVYMHRIDYLLSGDDGEEQFLKRLKDERVNLESGN